MQNIWTKTDAQYAEFTAEFSASGNEATLKITACHNYAVYLNGTFLANGQYADLPEYKSVDEIPFTPNDGINRLFIIATTTPQDYSTARVMPSFVAFEVEEDGKCILSSGEETLSRPSSYISYGDMISAQLGMGWKYDFTAKEEDFSHSRLVDIQTNYIPRPIPKTILSAPCQTEVVAQGIFKYRGGKTAAEKMQLSWMSSLRFGEMTGEDRLQKAKLCQPLTFTGKGGDGVFIIVDLGRICSGYPIFSITLDKACGGVFAWGEHLADLRIRAERAGRNFAAEMRFKAGKNTFEGYTRRCGCRYMCLFVENDSVQLDAFTFREERYPFKEIKRDFGDRLLNKIYDVGKRTLELCAHEHYEDCPWREQALYGMDSRNQMLFGYSAFEEYRLPRASLRLLARNLGTDGLLSLCAPARSAITIPAFSLYWVLAVCENAKADYDAEFVKEMLPYAESILCVFQNRTGEKGICRLHEKRYWNFHEWSNGLDGDFIFRDHEIEAIPDGILTALALYTAREFAMLEEKEGRTDKANEYRAFVDDLLAKTESFYDTEKRLYKSYLGDREYNYHGYMQALMLCANAVPKERVPYLLEELKSPKETVEMTYACLLWKYEALIDYAENGLDLVIEDICQQFGDMIFRGATSYWETALGEADFDDAGSLCHGWSAVACIVFERYLTDKNR